MPILETSFALLKKHRSLVAYAFFGVCTTAVNILTYYVCYNLMDMANVSSTIVAWTLAVLFAMVTNKLYVFDSKSFRWRVLVWELTTFYACRILTGLLDVGIMYVAVDICDWHPVLWKAISNILVIVLNYVGSKLIIFKHHHRRDSQDKGKAS